MMPTMLWGWSLALLFVASMLAVRWELSRLYQDARIPAPWDDVVPRRSPRLRVLSSLAQGTYVGAVLSSAISDAPLGRNLLP